jgi:hypothetical protein
VVSVKLSAQRAQLRLADHDLLTVGELDGVVAVRPDLQVAVVGDETHRALQARRIQPQPARLAAQLWHAAGAPAACMPRAALPMVLGDVDGRAHLRPNVAVVAEAVVAHLEDGAVNGAVKRRRQVDEKRLAERHEGLCACGDGDVLGREDVVEGGEEGLAREVARAEGRQLAVDLGGLLLASHRVSERRRHPLQHLRAAEDGRPDSSGEERVRLLVDEARDAADERRRHALGRRLPRL